MRILNNAELVQRFWQFEKSKRNTFGGEYRSLVSLVQAKKGYKLSLDFEDFVKIAGQPCKFCEEMTPGYECNSVNPERRGIFNEQSYSICWPCKNIFGDEPRNKPEQVMKIAKVLLTKGFKLNLPVRIPTETTPIDEECKPTVGLVYKLIINGIPYIGKTTQKLQNRISGHFKDCARENEVGKTSKVKDALNVANNMQWEILEADIPIEDLSERERFFILKYDAVMNGLNYALPNIN